MGSAHESNHLPGLSSLAAPVPCAHNNPLQLARTESHPDGLPTVHRTFRLHLKYRRNCDPAAARLRVRDFLHESTTPALGLVLQRIPVCFRIRRNRFSICKHPPTELSWHPDRKSTRLNSSHLGIS